MTYLIIIAFVLAFSSIQNKSIDISLVSNRRIEGKKLFVFICGLLLILICGLRHIEIGRDTLMYGSLFSSYSHLQSFSSFLKNYHYTEFAYYGLVFIISRFADYQFFLLIVAIISIAPVMFIIYRYSLNPMMSFILYICFTYYTFTMTGLRQSCAIGMIMFAYHFMKQKKLFLFIIFTSIAFFFHSSALIFIPIYWVDKIPYNKITICISAGLIICAYVFKNQLWSIATLFARQQYDSNDAGGNMMYLFMILTVVLGFWYRRNFINEDADNKILLYFQILSCFLWPIASINSAVARMYYYYHIFFILYVPTVINSISNKSERFIVTSGYYGVAIYFFITQILPETMKFEPYRFFWQ